MPSLAFSDLKEKKEEKMMKEKIAHESPKTEKKMKKLKEPNVIEEADVSVVKKSKIGWKAGSYIKNIEIKQPEKKPAATEKKPEEAENLKVAIAELAVTVAAQEVMMEAELKENGFRSTRRTKIACTIGPRTFFQVIIGGDGGGGFIGGGAIAAAPAGGAATAVDPPAAEEKKEEKEESDEDMGFSLFD